MSGKTKPEILTLRCRRDKKRRMWEIYKVKRGKIKFSGARCKEPTRKASTLYNPDRNLKTWVTQAKMGKPRRSSPCNMLARTAVPARVDRTKQQCTWKFEHDYRTYCSHAAGFSVLNLALLLIGVRDGIHGIPMILQNSDRTRPHLNQKHLQRK